MALTITEALAEIKTIGKRVSAKRASIRQYVARQEGLKDPLEKDGGSVEFIKRESQALGDLERRIIAIRRGIARANATTQITVGGVAMSIEDWLIWRRDVAPGQKEFLGSLRNDVSTIRANAKRQGQSVVREGEAEKPTDVVININEVELAKSIEGLEEVLGELDGQLSLKNATVAIEI